MVAHEVDHCDAVHAGDGAVGRAGFARGVFAIEIGLRVVFERDGGIAALLRAVVDEAVLTYIKVAGPGPASPLVRLAIGEPLH